ncbi:MULTISPECIES: class I SAM-dependent methyltransferase [unclassified Veillonella]|uniref:class I SAM-dependent methyltransferase n=1 Tax=unclassified Veillonella TaxID=2630086 RepID=UPI000F8C8440|nr:MULTISPECIES: class I SAM-dependent methyltransferase [unclassified Veillonella]
MRYNTRMTKEQAKEIYADLGYLSQPFPYASAPFLESYARLLGLSPAPAATARILEIGSSYGGNLMSQALFYPQATFTGIEIAPTQVSVGKTYIDQLGITNLDLLEGDVNESHDHLGTYDYIIAHGFYSWVDEETKDNFLRLCKEHLAENGILYMSYNTYPGWHKMDSVRALLEFANKDVDTLNHREKVRHGKTVASKLGALMLEYDTVKAQQGPFLQSLRQTLQKQDCYVGHDHLEPVNTPVYFHQCMDHMAEHGFTYLCDCDLNLSFPTVYDETLRTKLQELAPHDPLAREQYIDFMLNTAFRKSLFTHKGATPKRITETSVTDAGFQHTLEQFLFTLRIPSEHLEPIFEDLAKGMAISVADGNTTHGSATDTNNNTNTANTSNDKSGDTSGNADHTESVAKRLANLFQQEGPHFYVKNNTVMTHTGEHTIPDMCLPLFYQFLVEHIIQGGISLSVLETEHPFKHHIFEEKKSYIPERYIPFVEIMPQEGVNAYIYPGNRYNDPISDFNEEDLEFMKLLSKPTTKHDVMCKIYEAMTEESISPLALQQSNKYTMILAFYEEMIRRMEYFGFLEVDETQFS